HYETVVSPVASEESPPIEIDDVVLECERDVVFFTRPNDLALSGKREDVVANDVLTTIVLVESTTLGSVNDVVFQKDSAASLVRVQTPSAVIEGFHVVDQVVPDNSTGLHSKRIDRAHVRKP